MSDAQTVYAPIIDSNMTVPMALKQVIKISKAKQLSKIGFRQVASILEREMIKFVVVAKDFDKSASKVILGLCKAAKVPHIEIETRNELGDIAGVTNKSKTKVCKVGVVAVQDFGGDSEGKIFILNYLKTVPPIK